MYQPIEDRELNALSWLDTPMDTDKIKVSQTQDIVFILQSHVYEGIACNHADILRTPCKLEFPKCASVCSYLLKLIYENVGIIFDHCSHS